MIGRSENHNTYRIWKMKEDVGFELGCITSFSTKILTLSRHNIPEDHNILIKVQLGSRSLGLDLFETPQTDHFHAIFQVKGTGIESASVYAYAISSEVNTGYGTEISKQAWHFELHTKITQGGFPIEIFCDPNTNEISDPLVCNFENGDNGHSVAYVIDLDYNRSER